MRRRDSEAVRPACGINRSRYRNCLTPKRGFGGKGARLICLLNSWLLTTDPVFLSIAVLDLANIL